MAERLVAFSDFSGEMLADPQQVMEVTVLEHPDIDQPRGLQIGPQELEALREIAVEPVVLEVRQPDGEEPTRLVTTVERFGELSGERPMAEVLAEAKVVKVAKRAGASAVKAAAPEAARDYSSLEHAGRPHKGKVSPRKRPSLSGTTLRKSISVWRHRDCVRSTRATRSTRSATALKRRRANASS